MTPPCMTVRVVTKDPILSYPYGLVITEVGQRVGTGKVCYARPLPCVITPSTNIHFVSRAGVKVKELERNVMLIIDYGGSKDYLIYPKKVWRVVSERYFEPLSRGDSPREPGVLIYGPPGTGKTSMIDFFGDALGLHVVPIRPDAILSKYVGESERELSKRFREAENYEPSLVKMDDAEWIVKSRDLSSLTADTTVSLTLMNIMLEKIAYWGKRGRRILTCVATNASPSKIDPALLRSGRLGKPVFIPLPDYEAVYTLMRVLGLVRKVGEVKAREHAKRLISLGANMADARRYILTLLEGKEPELEDIEGRGYVRPMPTKLHGEELVERLKDIIPSYIFNSSRTRLYLAMDAAVGEALAVNYVLGVGKSPILVTDERYIDEALLTAEVSRSVLIVGADDISDNVLKIINRTAKVPIIYVGSRAPNVRCKVLIDYPSLKKVIGKEMLLKLVLDYYNVRYDDESFRRAVRLSGSSFDKMVEEIDVWGVGVDLGDFLEHYVT